jgi:hypothetical protein
MVHDIGSHDSITDPDVTASILDADTEYQFPEPGSCTEIASQSALGTWTVVFRAELLASANAQY